MARMKFICDICEEWAIAAGSMAGVLLVITFFARIYPIIPIQETITEQTEHHENN